ncbi:MAG: 50S ribosomal protein L18, partial [Candidatus Aenigmarchaeota archaeon]|nr:50S ribosomal protein L18 [Candidatus Aenigmarchaeota archaeon]
RQNAIYALVKGPNDAGLKVPVGEEILPSKERISGKHIADYAAKLRVENPVVYQKQFSAYLKNDVKPEDISKHFEDVKHRISTEVK